MSIHQISNHKNVKYLGGISLLVNCMTGPAIPFISNVVQTTGYGAVILIYIGICCLSTLCTLFIVESVRTIPANKHFQGLIEYGTLINFYFGQKTHYIAQLFLIGSVQSIAVQCIVITSQTFDTILLEWFSKTCGIAFTGKTFLCISETIPGYPTFAPMMFMTFGFLITIAICILLAILKFTENIYIQICAFVISLGLVLQWVIASVLFIRYGDPTLLPPTPVAFTGQGIPIAIATVLLSMAYSYVVPAWIGIKHKSVKPQNALFTASCIGMIIYLCVGILPAFGFVADVNGNILPGLSRYGIPSQLTKYTVFALSIVLLMPNIPIASIVVYQSLVQNNVIHKYFAFFLAYCLPAIVAIPLLNGNGLVKFLTWTAFIFVLGCNFVIPLTVYIKSYNFAKQFKRDAKLSKKQLELLKRIHLDSDRLQGIINQKIEEMDIKEGLHNRNTESLLDRNQQDHLKQTIALPILTDSTVIDISSPSKSSTRLRSPCKPTTDENDSIHTINTSINDQPQPTQCPSSEYDFEKSILIEDMKDYSPAPHTTAIESKTHFKLEDWIMLKFGQKSFVNDEASVKSPFVETDFYYSAEFKVLPEWFPLHDITVACICLVVSIVIMGLNIILYAMEQ